MVGKKRGHFIVIEGTDGSGKATQVRLLRKSLQVEGVPHVVIEFPRYSDNPYGKLIANYLKGEFGDKDQVSHYLISLAYAGDRFLAKPQIEARLKEGYLVIADRYVPSNKAFQSAKLPQDKRFEFIEWLDDLEYSVNGIPREELVIFLHVPPKVSQELFEKRGRKEYLKGQVKDIHEQDLKYQERVSEMYLELSKEEPGWEVIECVNGQEMKPPGDIHQEVLDILLKRQIVKV